jgi:hypothetical protein
MGNKQKQRESIMALPYEPRFKGDDTQDLVAQFKASGGEVRRCNTHSPITGQMRYYQISERKKRLEAGEDLYDLPYYLLTYAERKEQERRQEAAKQAKQGKGKK